MHKEENKYIQSPTDFPELGGGCANVQIIKKAKKTNLRITSVGFMTERILASEKSVAYCIGLCYFNPEFMARKGLKGKTVGTKCLQICSSRNMG